MKVTPIKVIDPTPTVADTFDKRVIEGSIIVFPKSKYKRKRPYLGS